MFMILILKLIPAILGLMLPGYLLAMALGLRLRLPAAFPLSALLLTTVVIGFSILGVPIRFGTVGACLGVWTIIFSILSLLRKKPAVSNESDQQTVKISRPLIAGCLGITLLIVAAMALRTIMYPLSGYDTFTRWESLALSMLSRESLAFYPPVTAEDYSIYFIPDGFPPLVASVYWWIYAAVGQQLQQATAISVVLQYVSCLALVFQGTLRAFSTRAAWFSLCAFSTATLLIEGFAMGQETGFTALSVAGQLCFALVAVRKPALPPVVTAALFAALGALSREYGPALAIAGFSVLLWHPNTRRYLGTFAIIAAACSAPWYIRNWAITGNPFYSHALPGGFTINTIHVALVASYADIFSLRQLSTTQQLEDAMMLCYGAPLPFLFGIPYGVIRWRDSAPMLMTAGVVTLLWMWSVSQTSGGFHYSMRVLTPAVTALAIPAGAALNYLSGRGKKYCGLLRFPAISICLASSLYAIGFAASHPYLPSANLDAISSSHIGTPELCSSEQQIAEYLETDYYLDLHGLASAGVLTDDQFLATMLKRTDHFRPVMIWSPEVDFVFDRKLGPQEIARRLVEKDIRILSIDRTTANYPFLSRFGFYKDTAGIMQRLEAIPGSTELYLITPWPAANGLQK